MTVLQNAAKKVQQNLRAVFCSLEVGCLTQRREEDGIRVPAQPRVSLPPPPPHTHPTPLWWIFSSTLCTRVHDPLPPPPLRKQQQNNNNHHTHTPTKCVADFLASLVHDGTRPPPPPAPTSPVPNCVADFFANLLHDGALLVSSTHPPPLHGVAVTWIFSRLVVPPPPPPNPSSPPPPAQLRGGLFGEPSAWRCACVGFSLGWVSSPPWSPPGSHAGAVHGLCWLAEIRVRAA